MTQATATYATVRPGPELCIWFDGALIATIPLSHHAALNMAMDILRELRGHEWPRAEKVASDPALSGAGAPGAFHERIKLNDDGTLDEVVAGRAILEQLDSGHWFLSMERADGSDVAVWLHSSRPITASWEERPPPRRITEGEV